MQRLRKDILKNKVFAFFSLIIVMLFSSCEEVVDVDLQTGEAKIVIDAEILWQKGTDGSEQVIKISKMASYYSTTTPKVSGANVRIENADGDVFTFTETEPGLYKCTNFVPVLNAEYKLFVTAEGQSFTAVEKLTSVTPINKIDQKLVPGFSGEDEIEVTFYYNDPIDESNFYLTDYQSSFLLFPEYELTDDELYNGNEISTRFSNEDMKSGDVLNITHRGISKNFFNYMNLILEAQSANPFMAPPANIRGNIVNVNDQNNYALGYFRLCEADKRSYQVN